MSEATVMAIISELYPRFSTEELACLLRLPEYEIWNRIDSAKRSSWESDWPSVRKAMAQIRARAFPIHPQISADVRGIPRTQGAGGLA